MKKAMSIREKVLLCILMILAAIVMYYYLFYMPVKEEVARLEDEYTAMDDTLIMTEAKLLRKSRMQKDLEAIRSGEVQQIKELPLYDNRQNIMMQLDRILAKAETYTLVFGPVEEDGVTVSRTISLDYVCAGYDASKQLLEEIYQGEYPCAFSNLNLSDDGSHISVDITYFEYKK